MGDLRITSWNINSVRLRIGLVAKFVAEHAPDVLCLQETKCPDDQLPLADFRAMGFTHWATRGQKGYNGVAILSRFPIGDIERLTFGGNDDARHVAATVHVGDKHVRVHNLYVPAGGDVADPEINAKFAHKLRFLADLDAWSTGAAKDRRTSVLLGDLNIAPGEHDVWNHKALLDVVSHTPVETDALDNLRLNGRWIDALRKQRPAPERVYSWWSYRAADWDAADKGRRLDHVWVTTDLDDAIADVSITRAARGWEKPSDHVPVTVALRP